MIKLPKEDTKDHKELKYKEAIKALNDLVKAKIAPSDVDGVGIRAMRDIKKGEKVYLDVFPEMFDLPYEKFKKLRPEIKEQILQMWPQVRNSSHFIFPVTRMQAYLNHSDNPNYDGKKDVALKNIKKGEEIFENYKVIDNWQEVYPWLANS